MQPAPLESHASPAQPLGMPPARFLRDYWQKRPLLIRGAFANFKNPLTPDDLAGLACEEAALSRIVLHDRKRDRWTLRSGPFAEADFADAAASATGRCSCRTSTSGTPTSPRCSRISRSCRAGASTT